VFDLTFVEGPAKLNDIDLRIDKNSGFEPKPIPRQKYFVD
jgi:hypothetical protein